MKRSCSKEGLRSLRDKRAHKLRPRVGAASSASTRHSGASGYLYAPCPYSIDLKISNAKPGCDQRFAERGIEQEGAKSYDCGSLQSYPWYDEIVMFVLNGDEAEAVATRHAVNSHAPVGPHLRGGYP
jgi:hypothetical protein